MNKRQYKKAAKNAMRVLIEHYGYRPESFSTIVRGGEVELDAPNGMPTHQVNSYCRLAPQFSPLRGTPIFWTEDYWCSDSDPRCLLELLSETRFWSGLTASEAKKMLEAA